jgi:hypothetical protein
MNPQTQDHSSRSCWGSRMSIVLLLNCTDAEQARVSKLPTDWETEKSLPFPPGSCDQLCMLNQSSFPTDSDAYVSSIASHHAFNLTNPWPKSRVTHTTNKLISFCIQILLCVHANRQVTRSLTQNYQSQLFNVILSWCDPPLICTIY